MEELRVQGNLDSSGSFSLDPALALEKLNRYQIEKPEEYILAMVRSAVAAGASHIEIECSRTQFSLRHDGRALPFEELVTLFSSLLINEQARDLTTARELARALQALSRFSPTSTRVISSDSNGSNLLEMGMRQLLVRRLESGPLQSYGLNQQETRVEVTGIRRPLFQGVLGGDWPEIKLLRRRCRLCPVPIHLHEMAINPPLRLTGTLAEMGTAKREMSIQLGPAHWTALPPTNWPYQALLVALPKTPSAAQIVLDGVSFDYPLDNWPPGFCCWVVNPPLRRDLGGSQWVRDENWLALKNWLEETAKEFLLELSRQELTLERAEMLQAAALLDEFALFFLKNWQGDFSHQLFPEIRRWRRGLGFGKERQEWIASYLQHGLQGEVDYYLNLE